MDSDAFISCVGEPEDSNEVQRLLASVGVTKKLRVPRDDIEARVDLPKLGLSLIFEPEGAKTSRLIFTGVQFFSDTEKGYTNFSGTLPGGITFADTQREVHAKLGKPALTKKSLRYDAWKPEGKLLTVEYAKGSGKVAMVSFELPEED